SKEEIGQMARMKLHRIIRYLDEYQPDELRTLRDEIDKRLEPQPQSPVVVNAVLDTVGRYADYNEHLLAVVEAIAPFENAINLINGIAIGYKTRGRDEQLRGSLTDAIRMIGGTSTDLLSKAKALGEEKVRLIQDNIQPTFIEYESAL